MHNIIIYAANNGRSISQNVASLNILVNNMVNLYYEHCADKWYHFCVYLYLILLRCHLSAYLLVLYKNLCIQLVQFHPLVGLFYLKLLYYQCYVAFVSKYVFFIKSLISDVLFLISTIFCVVMRLFN